MATRQWFTMKKLPDPDGPDKDGDEGEIMIYGSIGKSGWMEDEDEMSAADFDRELKKLGPVRRITMRINSPGGNVMDGLAIHNMLLAHPAKKTARVDGIAASAASMIAMAGDDIEMPENSFMLIHEPRGITFGTADDHRAQANDLQRMTDMFAGLYANKSGQKPEDVLTLMKENRLMPASEAKALGYCTKMCDPVKMEASFEMKTLPKEIRDQFSAAVKQSAAFGAVAAVAIAGAAGAAGATGAPGAVAAAAPAAVGATAGATGAADPVVDPALAIFTLCAESGVSAVTAAEYVALGFTLEQVKAKIDATRAPKEVLPSVGEVFALAAAAGFSAKEALEYYSARIPLSAIREKMAAKKARDTDATATIGSQEVADGTELPVLPFEYDKTIVARKKAVMKMAG